MNSSCWWPSADGADEAPFSTERPGTAMTHEKNHILPKRSVAGMT